MICPRCDGQGSVLKVQIIKTHENAFVCDECEATWFDFADISPASWVDFGTELERRNLRPVWEEVTVIGDAAIHFPP
jgi:hypothetical protein